MRERVVVAGATGFVGRYLMDALVEDYDVIALSRSLSSQGQVCAGVEWRRCDLFSLLDAERGLRGARFGVYLVHSMMPSARLTQGHFSDLDLVAADNFARAAKEAGLEQIVYLGGIIAPGQKLSKHLRSRLEVEQTLGAYGVPVTSLRAGMVLGQEGSSFRILLRLVERLPAMVCPSWTESLSQPIAIQDVVALLAYCIGKEETYDAHYDIGGPEQVTYRRLIELTASLRGRRPPIFRVPLFSPGLSRLWVSVVTGASRELVKPLIHSLKNDMLAADRRLQELAGIPGIGIEEALRDAIEAQPWQAVRPMFRPGEELAQREAHEAPRSRLVEHPKNAQSADFAETLGAVERSGAAGKGDAAQEPIQQTHRPHSPVSDVRAVQRLPLPPGKDATFVAEEYMRWLPGLLPALLQVDVEEGGRCSFRLKGLKAPLLLLEFCAARSRPDRQLFYIRGGLLACDEGRGRLEFRESLDGRCVLAAIHDYRPRLPWFVYLATQAVAHHWVMVMFGRHLERLAKGTPASLHQTSTS